MTVSKRVETRVQALIVVWAIASVIVPWGLALSVAIGIWLAWHRSPYLRFFMITVLAAMLVVAVAGLGGHAVFHR